MSKLKKFTTLILIVFVITSGFGCRWNPFEGDKELYEPVTLEYWGVWDSPGQINPLIVNYQASHPTISINYRNLRYEEYEQKLLEAWAEDRGPDVFAIPVTWLKEYQHRLEPMPLSLKIPVQEIQGTFKKEAITTLREFRGLSPYDIKNRYVPVVYDDIIINNQIYGLPYYLDTLVTFYNSDLLAKEGIAEPIKDFHDLAEQAPKLTKASEANRIYQSAVSLGGTDNIPRFFDIFSSIMLQNGVNAKGQYFNPVGDKDSAERFAQTFNFYTDFAKPGRASYSWNEDVENAFDMFINGKLAYFFGYTYHADELRQRSVPFDWGVTNFPQTRGADGTKYYTNYWVNVVPKKSDNKDVSWNFIQSTAGQDLVRQYLSDNKKPTALRSLIGEQLEDDDIRIFASQVLTADNWYEGYDINLAEQYLAETIESILAGALLVDQEGASLELFIQRINQTYQKQND